MSLVDTCIAEKITKLQFFKQPLGADCKIIAQVNMFTGEFFSNLSVHKKQTFLDSFVYTLGTTY